MDSIVRCPARFIGREGAYNIVGLVERVGGLRRVSECRKRSASTRDTHECGKTAMNKVQRNDLGRNARVLYETTPYCLGQAMNNGFHARNSTATGMMCDEGVDSGVDSG
jgi:hypothetical protein